MTIQALVGANIYQLGSSGDAVRQIQLALAKLGYPLNGTGYFGTATDTAVEAFQRRAGIDVDGEVGGATSAAIDHALSAPQAPAPTTRADISKPLWLQVSLANIGLKEGPGASDNAELVADIRTVADDYEHDATPWCAGWVSFCLVKAGIKPSASPLWALSYAEGWGQRLAGPAVGAIAVKTRTGGGHVTFIAGRTRNGLLACCGGNQNDMVNISEYRPDIFNKGFYWPKSVALPASVGTMTLPIVNASGKILSEA